MNGLTESLYRISPVWVQNVGLALFGLIWKHRRFGPAFHAALPGFKDRESYTSAEWEQYQMARLRKLLCWCYAEVPHYQKTWSEIGLGLSELGEFQLKDLIRLPITEKEQMRRTPAEFLAVSSANKRLHSYNTSGTTGTPLVVRLSAEVHQTWSAAYEARCRYWAKVDHRMSRAMIGGRMVVPNASSAPPFWRYNPIEKQVYFSAFHISPQNAPHYARALNQYKPDYLVGYASAHYYLARLFEEAGLTVYQPKAVLTSSDKLTESMRATLCRVYRCPVRDGYSGLEACCLASECEHQRLHVSPDVGIVELVNDQGRPVPLGEPGHIIATGLLNFDQPLIRYRMGDLAAWSGEICPCGRSMPIFAELFGRQEETVILRDGRRSASFYKVFQGIEGIQEAQVIQEDYESFILRLVADQRFTPLQQQIMLSNVHDRYGDVRVKLDLVDRIERTNRGKLRLVISKISSKPTQGQSASFP